MVCYQLFVFKDVVVECFYIVGQEGKDVDDLNLELNENVIIDKISVIYFKDGIVEIVFFFVFVFSYVI